MHGLDIELPAGKRTRLVEHHGIYLVQRVYIITALDKDAATRGTAYSAKEGERHADDQGAGTRHH